LRAICHLEHSEVVVVLVVVLIVLAVCFLIVVLGLQGPCYPLSLVVVKICQYHCTNMNVPLPQ